MSDFFSMMETMQGLFHSNDVEVLTHDGRSIRGRIDNLRSTQPFSKPAVKILGNDGKITKVLFSDVKEVINHDRAANKKGAAASAEELPPLPPLPNLSNSKLA